MITLTGLLHQARRTLLIRARSHSGLLALVPAENIDPVGVKPYPVITITDPQALPRRSACVLGADGSFDVHAFAGPKKTGSTVTMTGYDHISAIGVQIETVFAPNIVTLEDGSKCKLFFSDVRTLKDAAPDDWHWFGQLNCAVMKEIA